MQYRYLTADVFTDRAFGGNPLAVLPDARGLTTGQMHAIAREFNYSETTFVLPPQSGAHTRRVRIFTPGGEVPFAGHPTVGTAHVLAATGAIPLTGAETRILFEEEVGPVPVTIRATDGIPEFCQLSVARLPEPGPQTPDARDLAAMLSLEERDIAAGAWAPQFVSCGLEFLIVTVHGRQAVARARPRLDLFEQTMRGRWSEMVFVFAMDPALPGSHVRARMFAPTIGVPEDPATGSACAALGGYLAQRSNQQSGLERWVVEQGVEMGRPSIVEIEVDREEGRTTAVRVGGRSVLVCEGIMHVPLETADAAAVRSVPVTGS